MSNLLKFARILPANAVMGLTRRQMAPSMLQISSKRFASNYHQHQHHQQQQQQQDDILQYREKPESLSYFTGNFKYNDLLIELDALYKTFENWKPTDHIQVDGSGHVTHDKVYSWKLRDKMSELLSIPLTTSQWRKITAHLNTLASLPKPLPASVESILESYQRFDASIQSSGETKSRTLDEMGRAYAVGRRKESSARCYLVEGEGKVLVNGLDLEQYFQRSVDRSEVTLPLDVTELKDKFNAWILVKGGGSTGQAQAIKLGLGKALLIHNNELKPALRKAGCITRDPRVVERKKEGQRKARAKYTWVKR
ncbi:ribosomal protein S5 domain 2-type protein [Parasitella parasitica]|nr:ribosomal protein S5 domain 2-type protein [Parasitella parasitica]